MHVLAVVEIYHSRAFAPTRRLALGRRSLPVDPAPGPGGVLLGAIAATFIADLDDERLEDLSALMIQVREGHKVVQPRVRHRFQDDRVGLTTSEYALVRRADGELDVEFDHKASGTQALLGAVYAAGRLRTVERRSAFDAILKGVRWGGDVDRRLFAHLSGLSGSDWSADMYEDPVRWAVGILGLATGDGASIELPSRKEIQRRFRDALREAHPDHGGETDDAAKRIADLTEARKILLQ